MARVQGFLQCEGVEKRFGDTVVLGGITLGLDRGECLALLGPSGCGKTTLLNIISGLLAADAGAVRCDGETLDEPARQVRVPVARRRCAMVFQDFSLWPHMTLGENVAFGLKMLGMGRVDREARVRRELDRVGLGARAGDYPAQLSGGQQQRVAIARALAVEPRLLLLDEPLSALDATLREGLRDEIAALVRTLGITAVYVTHDQGEALAVAHRVAVMNAGRIEQFAPPVEIYQRPATPFVASFLGGANVFPDGSPSGEGTSWMVRREDVTIVPKGGSGPAGIAGRCTRCTFAGGGYDVSALTAEGESFRGLSPAEIAPQAEVLIRFDRGAVREFAPAR